MQIVIEIPEEIKDFISGKNIVSDDTACDYLYELRKSVNNGIVFPKGHGRLIDADAFVKEKTRQFCENCDRRRGMKDGKLAKKFVYEIGDAPCRACDTGDMIDMVDDAPTVIPADKEDKKC